MERGFNLLEQILSERRLRKRLFGSLANVRFALLNPLVRIDQAGQKLMRGDNLLDQRFILAIPIGIDKPREIAAVIGLISRMKKFGRDIPAKQGSVVRIENPEFRIDPRQREILPEQPVQKP